MSAAPSSNLRGVLSMLGAVLLFSVMDSCMKLLAPHYPAMQVTALRGLCSLPLVCAWVLLGGGPRQLLRVRWSLHLLRGVLAVLMLAAFVFALKYMPLAEAYALFFIAPLLITALAVPLLGEQVGWRRWCAIAVGLAGTVVVLRPSGAGMVSIGGLAVLGAALAYAVSAIAVRVLGRSDSTQSMVFWLLLMLSVFATAAAWPHWVPLQRGHWIVLAVLGVTGALGQWGITEAFRRSPASVIAPLEYTALGWGLGLDWLLWDTRPDRTMLVGAAIIVLAGLYLLQRERVAAVRPVEPARS
jgi:drug/metabolite transporter (DMT)-like permease